MRGDADCVLKPPCSGPVEASGVGLHSGVPVRIRILPAPVSTGIVFLRTDLDNFPDSRQLAQRRARQLRHQPDAAGRADLHHRAPAERVLLHGHRQRVCRDRQPRSAHPGRQRPAFRRADRGGRHPAVPPQAPLSAHSPADIGGRQRQAHQHPARREFPPDLRHGLSRTRSAANRSSWRSRPSGTRRRSRSRAPSAWKTIWTRCATWD